MQKKRQSIAGTEHRGGLICEFSRLKLPSQKFQKQLLYPGNCLEIDLTCPLPGRQRSTECELQRYFGARDLLTLQPLKRLPTFGQWQHNPLTAAAHRDRQMGIVVSE